ncbi:hypothetical protein [Desulfomonile tiedjei]|uniref:Uncharacterized protein n=1 Tax=Desulfomonile tiedjei (strain ATCC 49306 / DSM 6799 / DCB-1) TaxID=706587 RepID=I4CBV9_DESTA|nr:hypothetical protein [Desulfomonile tiedjei]AFM27050.1 hypothetical protein Desti_4418 [Desulfomonile tiedjei DSM 6799]
MDLLLNHLNALTCLFAGALCVILGMFFWVKEGDPLFGMIMCFGFGANLIAEGFLDLTKLRVPGWVTPITDAVCGIGLIWISISRFYASPSPRSRRTYWWFLAFGIGIIFVFRSMQHYWR